MPNNTQIPEEYKPSPTGITLYTLGTPNGLKISAALEALGLTYTVYKIDIQTKIQKEPWFLNHINPNGRIPAIIDNNGIEPIAVFESGAILLYLATKYDTEYKFSYAINTKEYFESLEWLFFQNAGVGPMQGQATHFTMYCPEKIEYAVKRYTDETRRLYSVLEQRLIDNKSGWLVGSHVSIVDLSTVVWVMCAFILGINVKEEYPNLEKWVFTILKIPEIYKGLNVPTPFANFTGDLWKFDN